MSRREILLPWNSQPQEAVELDSSNYLAKSLTYFLPLNGSNKESITGNNVTVAATGYFGVDQFGLSLRGNVTQACASMPLKLASHGLISVSFWMFWPSYANDDDIALEYGNTFASASGFIVDPNSGWPASGNIQTGVGKPTAANCVQFARPSAGAWHHYAFVFNRYTNTSASTTVYVDGELASVSAAGPLQAIGTNFADTTLHIFSRGGSSLFGAGRMANLAIRGSYSLSAEDVLAECLNPWQLFAPQRIWVPVSAASGPPTLAAIAASALTASGARLTVT